MKLLIPALSFGLGVSGAALVPRQSGCCFQINVGDGPGTGPLGQLSDGQNRVGTGYTAATYCINNGVITDSAGRGCILTAPTTQWQCDAGVSGTPGFSVGAGGAISYNGNTQFYECLVSAGIWNIYTTPGGTQCSPITLTTAGGVCAPATSPPATPTTTPPPAPPTVTVTGPGVTTTATITGPCSPTTATVAGPTVTATATVAGPTVTATATVAGPIITATATVTGPGVTTTVPGPSVTRTVTVIASVAPVTIITTTTIPVAGPTVTASATKTNTVTAPGATITATVAGPTITATATATATTTAPGTTITVAGPTVTRTAVQSVTVAGPGSTVTATVAGPTITVTVAGPAVISTVTAPGVASTITVTKMTPGATVTSTVTGPCAPNTITVQGPGNTHTVTAPVTVTSISTSTLTRTITTSASTPTSSTCPINIPSTTFQFPHLIVPVSSTSPTTALDTSYFGTVNATTSTIFNFDIPASYAGKTCTLVFLLPQASQLQTSSYTLSGTGGVHVLQLATPATAGTTYNNQPAVAKDLGNFAVTAGSSAVVATGACAAGMTLAYELRATGSLALSYFQDYNPAAIGLYITQC